jgi:hypothetical protein
MVWGRKIAWSFLLAAWFVPAFPQTSTDFTSIAVPSVSNTRSFVPNERHLRGMPLAALYANSAFAHGYRHGYEQGFHVGDLDLHMGREGRISLQAKEYQQGHREYNVGFGSKQSFEEGYHAGLRSGYADAVSGLEFRASERIRALAAGLDVLPPTRRSHFDIGFSDGFKSAHSTNAPHDRITFEYVEQYCHKIASGPYAPEYCSGFSRGYLLGTFNSQSSTSKIAASQANRP